VVAVSIVSADDLNGMPSLGHTSDCVGQELPYCSRVGSVELAYYKYLHFEKSLLLSSAPGIKKLNAIESSSGAEDCDGDFY